MGLEWIVRVHRRLGELLAAAGFEGRLVADEGGFGPRLANNRQALEFIVRAIEAARLRPGSDVALALDVASTHFFDGSHYRLAATGAERLSSGQLIDQLAELADAFPIRSIEDGLAEDDWSGWQQLTARLGERVQLVGDDLFTTNPQRLARGIELHAANSVLVKVNQIGTLSETFATIRLARRASYSLVVSARSGETEDTTLADLAVAVAAEQIKIGSITRSERLAKYNRLLAIEEQLSAGASRRTGLPQTCRANRLLGQFGFVRIGRHRHGGAGRLRAVGPAPPESTGPRAWANRPQSAELPGWARLGPSGLAGRRRPALSRRRYALPTSAGAAA